MILGAILLNLKLSLSSKEYEKLERLDLNILIWMNLTVCIVLATIIPNKDETWKMCVNYNWIQLKFCDTLSWFLVIQVLNLFK